MNWIQDAWDEDEIDGTSPDILFAPDLDRDWVYDDPLAQAVRELDVADDH